MERQKKQTIKYVFSNKHIEYIRKCAQHTINVAEGAVRAGKTVDNVYAFHTEIKNTDDKFHLATGSTVANAKLNIGDANGFGLEYLFRGQCHWGKYKDNEALFINGPATKNKLRIVIFAGGGKKDSFKKIRGNSYGMWIATEVNLHHQNTIKEAMNRTIASHKRKIFWDLNPDNPNAFIYTEYLDRYDQKKADGTFREKYYNYEHFTIHDNETITDERKQEIINEYDIHSIWYQRDILGRRVVAEGLIYRQFADDVSSKTYSYRINRPPINITDIFIGVDFGGNGSAHTFVAAALTRKQEICVLASHKIDCKKLDVDPNKLDNEFVDFCYMIQNKFGSITSVYCDSAEQTLINGLRSASRKNGLRIRIENALKVAINERIRFISRMLAQHRLYYLDGLCKTFEEAMCTCVWDPKNKVENERLDDGTSDIDTLDAFEYTIERMIARFMREE